MKKSLLLSGLLLSTLGLAAQSGTLDPTFSTDGIVQHDISATGLDAVYGMVQQADGKIVIAGYALDGTNANCYFARLKTDGSLDSTFSTDGVAVLDVGLGANDRIYDLAIQADGRIVGVGMANDGASDNVLVVRLDANGDPDVFLGGSGIVKLDLSLGENERANAVALQPDGKIVVAGLQYNGSNNDWMVARLNTDGTPDTGFDVTGSVSLDVNGFNDVLEGVAIAPDGKIVAVGAANDGSSDNVLVIRLDSAGQPDNTFSSDGKFSADLELTTTDYAMDCKVYPDGYIIVAGYVTPGGNSNGMMLRLREDGILDGTFGISGIATYDPSIGNTDRFSQVQLLADGGIVAGGYTLQPGTDTDFLLIKADSKGDLDADFNGSGTAIFDAGNDVPDPMRCMAIQDDGKLLVGGYSSSKTTIIRVNHDLPLALSLGQSPSFTAWPMPFGSSFQVQLGSDVRGPASWQLISMNGLLVASGNEANPSGTPLSIQVSESLPTGIYLLRVQAGGSTWAQQVMHQH